MHCWGTKIVEEGQESITRLFNKFSLRARGIWYLRQPRCFPVEDLWFSKEDFTGVCQCHGSATESGTMQLVVSTVPGSRSAASTRDIHRLRTSNTNHMSQRCYDRMYMFKTSTLFHRT